MISPSEQAEAFLPGAQGRGAPSVVELLMRSGVPRSVAKIWFPELEKQAEAEEARGERAGDAPRSEGEDREMAILLRIAAAREEAYQLARKNYEGELAAQLEEERGRVDRLRLEFARDRQRFFAAAESQVVRLALAVASRVLAREVARDPGHLLPVVKAALARVHDHTSTVLRVPAGQLRLWAEMVERGAVGAVRVEGDERMQAGECVLETSVGRVELGIEVQMAEVERSFGELLQVEAPARPEPGQPEPGQPDEEDAEPAS